MVHGQQQRFAEGDMAVPEWEKVIITESVVYDFQIATQPKTFLCMRSIQRMATLAQGTE
jgi:hypothetical protein